MIPNTGPAVLVPSPFIELQMGQASGTALPPRTLTHKHAGTLSYHNVKIKEWKRERKKKTFSSVCLLLGTLGTQAGASDLGRGHLAFKDSSRGAGGYRMGGHPQRLCTKEEMPPFSPQ